MWKALACVVLAIAAEGGLAADGPRNAASAGRPRLVTQMGHSSAPHAASLVPDQRSLLTAGAGEVIVWDRARIFETRRFAEQQGNVQAIAVSPDGKHVAVASDFDRVVRLYDISTGTVVRRFEGHSNDVMSVAFDPGGSQLMTGSRDGTARLWDVSTGKEMGRLKEGEGVVLAVAISPDGRFAVTGRGDGNAVVWDLARRSVTQELLHEGAVTSVAFHPSRPWVVTGTQWDLPRLWNYSTGARLGNFAAPARCASTSSPGTASVAFSPSGRHVMAAVSCVYALKADKRVFSGGIPWSLYGVEVWEAGSRRSVRSIGGASVDEEIRAATFVDDTRIVTAGLADIREWVTGTDRPVRDTTARVLPTNQLGFSGEGRQLWVIGEDDARVWDLEAGGLLRRIALRAFRHHAVVSVSPDGRVLAAGHDDGSVRFLDSATGTVGRQLVPHQGAVNALTYSDDGDLLITAAQDGTARVMRSHTGETLQELRHGGPVGYAHLSADKLFVLTSSKEIPGRWADLDTMRVWSVETGREVARFDGEDYSWIAFTPTGHRLVGKVNLYPMLKVWDPAPGGQAQSYTLEAHRLLTFSPDGKHALFSAGDGTIIAWHLDTGEVTHRWPGHAALVMSATFSPDGRRLLTTSRDHTARLWEWPAVREVAVLAGHDNDVRDGAFSPDGRLVATAGEDRRVQLWDAATGAAVAALVSFPDDTWTVVSPEGHFDTERLEDIRGVHWVMSDDPLRAQPLEIFMRDYYEPRLLPRLLAGEKPVPMRALSELNRTQPKVRILSVEHERRPAAEDTVTVTVEVAGARDDFGPEGHKRIATTGAYDLRLFRDGQLVGQLPDPEAAVTSAQGNVQAMAGAHELSGWRSARRLIEAGQAAGRFVFRGIRLPGRKGAKTVHFEAYAFNEDRVKSETARYPFDLPIGVRGRIPRAIIVSIGVNQFDDAQIKALRYAANDARRLGQVLKTRLEAAVDDRGEVLYEQVLWVPLVSEGSTRQATKARIEAVLRTLAGQPANRELLEGVPGADRLRRAGPDDLVVLAISTHGVGAGGRFYLYPQDMAPSAFMSSRLTNAISSDELSIWLRGLDASDIVMIVDACHSAATVQSGEFKPGPMGSRGLGQLAYDQRMRILAATQVDEYAMEVGATELGLLTYALVHEGLERNEADFRPTDGTIRLSEWLAFANVRVPTLYRDWMEGRLRGGKSGGEPLVRLGESPGATRGRQRPQLFDFARGRDAVIARAVKTP